MNDRHMGRLIPLAVLGAVLSGGGLVIGGELKPAAIFCDHVVLQAGANVPVWGKADPGEEIEVVLADRVAKGRADAHGKWLVQLPPLSPSSAPVEMTIRGREERREIADVLVGDVWFCSGQSNMAWPVASSNNTAEEIEGSAQYPEVRLFMASKQIGLSKLEETVGQWVIASPETVGGFSAVAYFFGRALHRQLGVPVGLIESAWGGTPIESWMSRATLERFPFLKPALVARDAELAGYDAAAAQHRFDEAMDKWEEAAAKAKAEKKPVPTKPVLQDPRRSPSLPGCLYNGMVAPFQNFAIRGAIWYQGETNIGRATQYRELFPALIRDWRTGWGRGDFPFLFVQLANFKEVQTHPVQVGSSWALLREAQASALALPNTGMAVAIDLGDANDVHFRNKQEVGTRLALAARAVAYGERVDYSGPTFESMKVEGEKVTVQFRHAGGGLTTSGGGALRGFAIAGEDRRWEWAEAKIEKEGVVLSCDSISAPVAVRYGWADNPIGNLANREGLPAAPFRTDDWPDPVPVKSAPAVR